MRSELENLRAQVRDQKKEIAKLKQCLRLLYLDGCKRLQQQLQLEGQRFLKNAVSCITVLKEIHMHPSFLELQMFDVREPLVVQ